MGTEKSFSYRADIDGLRAIAILLVVVFHAFPQVLPGGFIGVDVFFVISGYLITGIFLTQNGSTFRKIGHFYIRRIRRIFPALILLLYAAFFLGWHTLYATELEKLGLHILGGAGFFANIVYAQEAGYFDTLSSKKILLHLWSLSVEEQFYLIWPICLAVGLKYKNLRMLVAVLVAASLIASVALTHGYKDFAYYSLVTRFWQIGAGGWLAIYAQSKQGLPVLKKPKEMDTLLLGVLLFFAVWIDRSDVYPGFLAVGPVLVVMLLLHQPSAQSFYWRLVNAKPMVYIGLISYPLYLWHWSILAYMTYLDPQSKLPVHRAPAVLAAFLLAVVTYELIEKTLKKIRSIYMVPILIILLAIIGFIGLNAYERKGYDFRERNAIYKTSPAQTHVTQDCLDRHEGFKKITFCRIDASDKKVDVILVGDSHAHQYFSSLAEGYRRDGKNLLNIGWAGRKPFLLDDQVGLNEWSIEMSKMMEKYLEEQTVKVFVLAFYQPQQWSDEFERQLRRTLKKLKVAGKKVIYIEDNPNIGFSPVDCLGFAPLRPPLRDNCTLDYKKLPPAYFEIKEKIHVIVKAEGGITYDYSQLLCPGGTCPLLSEGKLLFEEAAYISQDTAKVVMAPFPYRYGF